MDDDGFGDVAEFAERFGHAGKTADVASLRTDFALQRENLLREAFDFRGLPTTSSSALTVTKCSRVRLRSRMAAIGTLHAATVDTLHFRKAMKESMWPEHQLRRAFRNFGAMSASNFG